MLRALSLCLGALLVGAGCGGTGQAQGGLILEVEREGTVTGSRDAAVSAGQVWMGLGGGVEVNVRNSGPGEITVTAVDQQAAGPEWTVSFEEGRALASGERMPVRISFAPPEAGEAVTLHEATFVIRADGARPGEETALLTVSGEGVPGACELPLRVDFGNMVVGESGRRTLSLKNLTGDATSATIGAVTSETGAQVAAAFSTSPGAGELGLAAREERELLIDFQPLQFGTHVARVEVKAAAYCPAKTILLEGRGIAAWMGMSPVGVECGYVMPGLEVFREIVFTNNAAHDFQISNARVQNLNEFRVVPPTAFAIPAGGTATMTVGCKPSMTGQRQTTLTFNTDLLGQPSAQLPVRVIGGGPDIDVSPFPTLDFGKVAFFQGANPPGFARRKLTVRNKGIAPPVADPMANLRLGTPDDLGHPHHPWFTVVPLNVDTTTAEFAVAMPAAYDPWKGLVAKAGEDSLELEVTFTPSSLGLKQGKLTIFSNDQDEPAVEVTLTANAVDVPACNYALSAPALGFGMLAPPQSRERTARLTNLGTDPGDLCLVSEPQLTQGSEGSFSLLQSHAGGLELGPQEWVDFEVRFTAPTVAATSPQSFGGNLGFFVSSPTSPQVNVSLHAQVGSECLVIAPRDLDFGTVQPGCATETREVKLYNTCSFAVGVQGMSLVAGTGEQALEVVSGPAGAFIVPAGGAPEILEVRFAPTATGASTGVLAFHGVTGGTSVSWMSTWKGRATASGVQVDVFFSPLKPKVDLLFVVDNSASAGVLQQQLATNLMQLTKFADAAKIDLHLGYVAADDQDPSVAGVIQSSPMVGTSASSTERCLGPALRALSLPRIGSDNSGFLRHDAPLAIVCAVENPDSSPLPAAAYLDLFWNLKGHARKTDFSFHAIAGFNPSSPPGCGFTDGGLAHLSMQTWGVQRDACAADWPAVMGELGGAALGPRAFFLTSAPDAAQTPVTVAINGVNVPSEDPLTNAPIWSFDAATNVVRFEPMFWPEPGQTASVTYATQCN